MSFQASAAQSSQKNQLKITFSSVKRNCMSLKWRKSTFLLRKKLQTCCKLAERIGKRSMYTYSSNIPLHSVALNNFQAKMVKCNFNCFFRFCRKEINVCTSSLQVATKNTLFSVNEPHFNVSKKKFYVHLISYFFSLLSQFPLY